MQLSPRLQKALNIAVKQHEGQYRYAQTRLPYIVHPFSVACLLSEWTENEDIIIAGLLHDVIEDTKGYTYEDIIKDFGKKVSEIVFEVSENQELPRDQWKADRLERMETASDEAILVFAADKIHNAESLLDGKLRGDEALMKQFRFADAKELPKQDAWALRIVESRLQNHPAVERLRAVYKNLLN